MKKNLIFCYILLATAAAVTANCNLNCIVNGTEIKHIACGNKGEFGPKCPKNVTLLNMDESLQIFFVDQINVLRNLIAGGGNSTYKSTYNSTYKPACRMATIQWDEDLAKYAALQAQQCHDNDNETNTCRGTDSFPISGQVLYKMGYFFDVSYRGIIELSVEDWTEYILTNGHEGAILSDSDTHMGCGIVFGLSHYVNIVREKVYYYTYWIACNFANDSKDRKICKSAGEECKNKPIARYPNLCAVGETYEN